MCFRFCFSEQLCFRSKRFRIFPPRKKLGRNVFDDTFLNKQGSNGAEDTLQKQSLLLENKKMFLPRVKLWPVSFSTSLANRMESISGSLSNDRTTATPKTTPGQKWIYILPAKFEIVSFFCHPRQNRNVKELYVVWGTRTTTANFCYFLELNEGFH